MPRKTSNELTADEIPQGLGDSDVAVLDGLEPGPDPEQLHSDWSELESKLLRSHDGESSLSDEETLSARFSDPERKSETNRVLRVRGLRDVAVTNEELSELETAERETDREVTAGISAENDRFDQLRQEHDQKIRALERKRQDARQLFQSALSARDQLRAQAPVAARRLHNARRQAVKKHFHVPVVEAESRLRTLEGIAALTTSDDDVEMVRGQVHQQGSMFYRPDLIPTARRIEAFRKVGPELINEVKRQAQAELPTLREEFIRAKAVMEEQLRKADELLDVYLPK